MKVQPHFAIDDAAHPFDQAVRLVIFLPDADDVVQRHARGTVKVDWWMIWLPASKSGTMKWHVAP